ncbi:MAG: hypothetical protein ABSF98_28420, partial [Bryobacteraceae bacterium]
LDGLSLTRQIRADGRFAGLPVIALSSLAGEEEIARGMATGVDEYQISCSQTCSSSSFSPHAWHASRARAFFFFATALRMLSVNSSLLSW